MRARGKDHDMLIKWGSLYTVVQNLERHGFLEIIGTDRKGARPERTVYRITEAGRQELADWTRDLISNPQPEHPRFAAGLSVLTALPPEEVIALLRIRLGTLRESITDRRALIDEHSAEIPRVFLIENEYTVAIMAAEAAWVQSLLDELISGTYPGLSAWRHWHRTGDTGRTRRTG